MRNDSIYIRYYKSIYRWYEKHLWAVIAVNILYYILPALAVLLYMDLIWLVLVNGGKVMVLKVTGVPFITFAGVSIFRKCINAQRPYTKYDIIPIVKKDKKGESMPSRHTASFTAIAMAWIYVNPKVGAFIMFLALLMAADSVLAGVHFIRDVSAAYAVSVVIGVAGFFLI